MALPALVARLVAAIAVSALWPISAIGADGVPQDGAPRSQNDDGAAVGRADRGERTPPAKKAKKKAHPSLRFGKTLRIEFDAKFQEDVHRSYDGAGSALSTFELRRKRVGISGTAFEHVDFEVERELAAQTLTAEETALGMFPGSPWKDVYVNVDYVKRLQVRAGRFKIPFGLDELTNVAQTDFIYRSLGAEHLAPARDAGVVVHGRLFARALSYSGGVFAHDGDHARTKRTQGGDRTFAGRMTAAPLRRVAPSWLGGLAAGFSVAATTLSDDSGWPNGLRGRTVVTEDTFFAPVYVNGRRWRWGGDLDWTFGAASIRSEYTGVTDRRSRQGIGGLDLPDVYYRAWYASASYVLTGERYARPLAPGNKLLGGHIGAVALAARYERLWAGGAGGQEPPSRSPRAEHLAPSGDRVVTVGVNWIVNGWLKVQVNGIREQVEDAARSPVPSGAAFWSRVVRFQFVL